MIFGTLKVLLFGEGNGIPKPNIFVLFKFGFKSVWVVLEGFQRVRFQRLNIHSFIHSFQFLQSILNNTTHSTKSRNSISYFESLWNMALNPQLFPNGMPVPFVNEMFVLARDGVEFDVDKIPTAGYYSLSYHYYFHSFTII
jgi:hypothetical protein